MAISRIAGRYFKEFVGTASGTSSEGSTALFGVGGGSVRCNPTTTGTGSVQFASGFGYFQVAIRIDTAPASGSEMILSDGGSNQWEVRVNSDLKLDLYSTTTLKSAGATVLSLGTDYMLRVKLEDVAASNVTLQIWNGSAFVDEWVGTVSWVGRSHSTVFNVGKFANRNGQSVDFKYAHLAFDSAAYPPYSYNTYLEPTALSGSTSWTNAAGTRPTNVQNPDDDATSAIRSTGTSGDECVFSHDSAATLGIGSGTINAVRAMSRTKVSSIAGSTATRIKSSSTNSDSTTLVNSGTWATDMANVHITTTDPATSAAWTTSGLDAAAIGVVEKGTTNTSDCTTVYGLVSHSPAPPITADASITQDADASSGAATAAVIVLSALSQDDDSEAGVSANGIVTTLTLSQSDDSLASSAASAIAITAGISQDGDSCASESTVASVADASIAAEPDVCNSAATNAITADQSVSQEVDTVTSEATNGITVSAAITSDDDVSTSTSTVSISADLGLAQMDDGGESAVTIAIGVAANILAEGDSVSSLSTSAIVGSVVLLQDSDSLSSLMAAGISTDITLTQESDSFTGLAILAISCAASITQEDDALSSTADIAGGQLLLVRRRALCS